MESWLPNPSDCGLKNLKSDKVSVENVYSKLRQIFGHYTEQGEQQRKQAYQTLKTEFEAKVRQALQQQLGSVAGIKIDVERQPQFLEEWHKIQTQLDSQYLKLLDWQSSARLAILITDEPCNNGIYIGTGDCLQSWFI